MDNNNLGQQEIREEGEGRNHLLGFIPLPNYVRMNRLAKGVASVCAGVIVIELFACFAGIIVVAAGAEAGSAVLAGSVLALVATVPVSAVVIACSNKNMRQVAAAYEHNPALDRPPEARVQNFLAGLDQDGAFVDNHFNADPTADPANQVQPFQRDEDDTQNIDTQGRGTPSSTPENELGSTSRLDSVEGLRRGGISQ